MFTEFSNQSAQLYWMYLAIAMFSRFIFNIYRYWTMGWEKEVRLT